MQRNDLAVVDRGFGHGDQPVCLPPQDTKAAVDGFVGEFQTGKDLHEQEAHQPGNAVAAVNRSTRGACLPAAIHPVRHVSGQHLLQPLDLSPPGGVQEPFGQPALVIERDARVPLWHVDTFSRPLDQARLDLRNTKVIAPADGFVTNLRLASGQYVAPGQPLLSFLENGPRWISADMRENQIGNVKPGQKVLVALDVRPGKLFHGRVQSIGWGISQGDEAPTGQLSTVQPDQGWLRQPQRFPVRILLLPDELKDAKVEFGRSGAQANVIVLTEDRSILNPVGWLWIKAVALLSYLQ